MPVHAKKFGRCYGTAEASGKKSSHSGKCMTKANAQAQARIINAALRRKAK